MMLRVARRISPALLAAFVALPAHALVDMNNASYSNQWVDIDSLAAGSTKLKLDGPPEEYLLGLGVSRAYKSRTLFDGMFGFGWCSMLETRLSFSAVGTATLSYCGDGKQLTFGDRQSMQAVPKLADRLIQDLQQEHRQGLNARLGFESGLWSQLRAHMLQDEDVVTKLAARQGAVVQISPGAVLKEQGSGRASLQFEADRIVHSSPDSDVSMIFSRQGRLTGLKHRDGRQVTIRYTADKPVRVEDGQGRWLDILYGTNGKVREVRQYAKPGTAFISSEYVQDDRGDLVKNWNAWAKSRDDVYLFEYNDFHNLTRATWPDKTSIRIAYDNAKDWVIGFQDRNSCIEDYGYTIFSRFHYFSQVTKTCDGKVVARNHYEFWHEERSGGRVVLQRVKTRVSGEETDVSYDPVYEKPLRHRRGGLDVSFAYAPDGRMTRRQVADRRWEFSLERASKGPAATVVIEHELDRKGRSVRRRGLDKDPWENPYWMPAAEREAMLARIGQAPRLADQKFKEQLNEQQRSDALLAEFLTQWHAMRKDEKFDQAPALVKAWDARFVSSPDALGDRTQLGLLAQVLAEDLANSKHVRTALELERQVLKLAGELPTVDGTRAALLGARLLRDEGKAADGVAMLDEAVALLMRPTQSGTDGRGPALRSLHFARSDLLQFMDQSAGALAAIQAADRADKAAESESLERVGEIYQAAGLPEASLRQYRRSLAAFLVLIDPLNEWSDQRDRGPKDALRMLDWMEAAYSELGRYDVALALNDIRQGRAKAAAGGSETGGKAHVVADILADRCLYFTQSGQYAQAFRVSDEALKLSGDNATVRARVLGTRATLMVRMGDTQGAVGLQREIQGLGEMKGAAQIGNFASDLGDAGHFDEAQARFSEAMQIEQQRLPAGHPSIANLKYLWAAMLVRQGPAKWPQAQLLLSDAVREYEQAHGLGHWRTARALSLQARLLLMMGDAPQSLVAARRAVDSSYQSAQREWEAAADHAMSRSLAALGQTALAVFYAKRAVNEMQEMRASVSSLESQWQSSYLRSRRDLYEHAAGLLIEAGRLAEAQQVLAMFKEDELQDFTRRSGGADPRATRAEMNGAEPRWNVELQEVIGQLGRAGKDLAELDALRRIGALDEAQTARRAQLRKTVDDAQARFSQVLERIRKESENQSAEDVRAAHEAALRAGGNLRSLLARLSQQSGSRTVALQYLQTDKKLHILVTTPELQFAREVAVGAAQMNREVQALREVLQKPSQDPVASAQNMYRHLLAPVSEELEKTGAQTLMVSLTGTLRYVPMAALHDGQGWLVERYRIALMTEAALTLGMEKPRPQWDVGGLGVAAKVSAGFVALPAVRDEIMRIVKSPQAPQGVMPGQAWMDADFTAARYREVLDDSPAVIHLASHFKFTPGSDVGSFLLLGDGKQLSLRDLMSESYRFRQIDLLTLSACETAVGGGRDDAGREVEGLAALAQKQGAPAVLATLWPVADASTGQLMQRFYGLRQSDGGLVKAEALRRAQLEMISGKAGAGQGGALLASRGATAVLARQDLPASESVYRPVAGAPFAHPFFWAPFVLIGNWL